jgi:predicted transcriptional regulator
MNETFRSERKATQFEIAQQEHIENLKKELAEARAEIERLKRENVELLVKYDEKFDVIDAKDKLIEQMREALENLRKYPATYIESGHQNPILRAWRHRKM